MAELALAPLKNRLKWFVATILAAIIAISAWSMLTERRDALATAERQAEGYAKALAEHSESALAEADRVALSVLSDIKTKGGSSRFEPRELYELLRHHAEGSPQIGALFLADRAGTMFTNTMQFPPKQIAIGDRDYFQHYLTTPGADLTIGKPVLSRLTNRWRFNLMRPLNLPHEPFNGLLAVAFEVEYFKRFFSPASLGPQGKVLLIRTDGAPLVNEPYADQAYEVNFQNSVLFKEKLPAAAFGTFHGGLTGETDQIISYRRLSRFPLVAVIALQEKDVLATWMRKAMLQGGLTLGFCLVVLLLMTLLLRHLRQLQDAQSKIIRQQDELTVKAAQIDAANDAILQIDGTGRLVQFNQALCQMTGYSRQELAKMYLTDIESPSPSGLPLANTLQTDIDQVTFETEYVVKSGQIMPVEVHARRMNTDGQELLLCIVRNVTLRKRVELREQTRLRILEEMATGKPLQDLLEHIVNYVEQESSGALCSILLADEAGARLHHGMAPSLPEEYNRSVDGVRIAKGMGSCGTAAFLRQRVLIEDIVDHPYWQGCKPAIDAGLRAAWSEPLLSAEGELLGTLAIYYREPRLPRQEEGALLESAAHLASLAIGRVRSEERRERLEEQLLHVQKIEAVGQLAGGIAHDFNNLLTPIVGYAEMIKLSLPEGDPIVKRAEGIISASLKARDLTRKLLSFGRKQMLCMDLLDLNEILQSFQDILRRTIRENIRIDERLCSDAAQVMGDRGQLEQIILNLAVNAQDAISGNGIITIETGYVTLDDEYARIHPGIRVGTYVLLAFTDNGCGMSEDVLQHIFEPFYTTKTLGHGTGLGLAMVYGIIKQHEGLVEVSSKEGQGTTFKIYLPAQAGESFRVADTTPVMAAVQAPEQQQTVLVVEDNGMVRDMAVELLTSAGYRVLSAESPLVALALAEHLAGAIHGLVSDVIMPEMDGLELYERLQVIFPGLPVLFMSGYTSDVAIHRGVLEEGVNVLLKPFTTEQFLLRVREILTR
jgi:two-component system, cell cycle sensor histidine kinase and response regulator CckA